MRRCFSVVRKKTPSKQPLLLCFHGSGGSDLQCHSTKQQTGSHTTLADAAVDNGFAVIALETATGVVANTRSGSGGDDVDIWDIPSMTTYTPCGSNHSSDADYVDKVIQHLQEQGEYNMDRIYVFGTSIGASASAYHTHCLRLKHGDSFIQSFGMHSTGLFMQGDGNVHPGYHGLGSTTTEQVASGGTSGTIYPIVPTKEANLKACVFDNSEDQLHNPDGMMIDFFKSSQLFGVKWSELGNSVETHFHTGGSHGQIQDWAAILHCLDEGSGALISGRRRPWHRGGPR